MKREWILHQTVDESQNTPGLHFARWTVNTRISRTDKYLTCTAIDGDKKRKCLLIRNIKSLMIQALNNFNPVGIWCLYPKFPAGLECPILCSKYEDKKSK